MVQYSSCLKSRISFSRSTISLTTTDCTLPAERPGLTVFHKTAELISDQPSRMRRVCWALTRLMSMLRGAAMPFLMPVLVISLKVTRFFSSLSSPSMLERCRKWPRPRGPGRSRGRQSWNVWPLFSADCATLPLAADVDIFRLEVMFDIHTQAAFGQVADVAHRGHHLIALAEVFLDGLGLGRGLHNHQLGGRLGRLFRRCFFCGCLGSGLFSRPSFWLLSFSQRLLSQFFCPFPKPLVFRLPWKPPLLFPVLQSQMGSRFIFLKC